MKHRLTTLSPLAVVLAATAILSTSATLAQSGDDTLWLKCRETSRGEGTDHVGFANGVFAVKANSIVSYDRQGDGDIDRWGDLCEQGSSACTINEDEISARFSSAAGEYFLEIDRRTGMLESEFFMDGEKRGFWTGQCSRVTDPRPPAAF